MQLVRGIYQWMKLERLFMIHLILIVINLFPELYNTTVLYREIEAFLFTIKYQYCKEKLCDKRSVDFCSN